MLWVYQRDGMSVFANIGSPSAPTSLPTGATGSFSIWQWVHHVNGSFLLHCLFMNSTASAFLACALAQFHCSSVTGFHGNGRGMLGDALPTTLNLSANSTSRSRSTPRTIRGSRCGNG